MKKPRRRQERRNRSREFVKMLAARLAADVHGAASLPLKVEEIGPTLHQRASRIVSNFGKREVAHVIFGTERTCGEVWPNEYLQGFPEDLSPRRFAKTMAAYILMLEATHYLLERDWVEMPDERKRNSTLRFQPRGVYQGGRKP